MIFEQSLETPKKTPVRENSEEDLENLLDTKRATAYFEQKHQFVDVMCINCFACIPEEEVDSHSRTCSDNHELEEITGIYRRRQQTGQEVGAEDRTFKVLKSIQSRMSALRRSPEGLFLELPEMNHLQELEKMSYIILKAQRVCQSCIIMLRLMCWSTSAES